jgi:serine/threonine-protein kinase RsbW
MKWSLSITMESSLEGVRKLAGIVSAALADEVRHQVRSEVELALLEACTNAVKYGSRAETEGEFRVEVEQGGLEVRVVVENRGDPFNFTATRPQFDPQRLETLPTRGMGLALICDLMEDVRYEAERGLNRLVMVKHLDSAANGEERVEVGP